MEIGPTVLITLLSSIIGMLIGVLTYGKNRDKDIKNDAKEDAETKAKLDYISRGVDDIKLDNKQRDREFLEMNNRVAVLEQSVTTAHKRIDTVEGRVNGKV